MKRMPILTAAVLAAVIAGSVAFLQQQSSLIADDAATSQEEASASTTDSLASEEAVNLLQRSRDLLFERKSVRATLHETVSMGDRKFRASGTYVAGTFPKLRLEFDVEVGKTKGKLREICDGTLLWSEQTLETAGGKEPTVQVSRTVIDDVLQAVAQSGNDPRAKLIAGLGMGGVPALLAALEQAMIFDAMTTDEIEGHSFFVIQGRWNDDYLARFGGSGGRPLPDYVPDHVRLYIDQETLFPARILYLKQVTGNVAEPGARKYRAMLALEFSDIVLDGPVSEEDFRYRPPGEIETRDRTKELLDLIEKATQAVESEPSGAAP